MNILIIGFGNMGCRHAQSLLNDNNTGNSYFVIEPNSTIFYENLSKIGANEEQLTRIENIDLLSNKIDFAIVATSSSPRYDIVKALIKKGVKYFLLEKVVFQSASQFDDIIELIDQSGCVAYCNFVNRYFPNYINIKDKVRNEYPLTMIVSGGDFGLACNALHYIDLFEYLTGKKIKIKKHKLFENSNGNRRGNIYKELVGQIVLTTDNRDELIISAEPNRLGGNEILIKQGSTFDLLNEETKRHIHSSDEKIIVNDNFEIIYTSQLTARIVKDILKGTTLLPSIQQVKSCHVELFKAANFTFGLPANEICPIT